MKKQEKTGKEETGKKQSLLCGYNCFISDENSSGQRADTLISNLCHDDLKLGGAYLNITTQPDSRYTMAFPYGNHTSIIDVSAGENMYINRENFVACYLPEVEVNKEYHVTTKNTDVAKLLMNKERWLSVGAKASGSTSTVQSKRSRKQTHPPTRRLSRSQKTPPTRKLSRALGGNNSYSIALGGHSQLSLVKLRYNSIQVDDDNVVAVIGNIDNITIDVIHSAQKKNSLTGTTAGRSVTGQRTGEGIHFKISHKNPAEQNNPIYVVLQGNVYGRTEVIADIHAHASSNNSGGN